MKINNIKFDKIVNNNILLKNLNKNIIKFKRLSIIKNIKF